MTAEWTLPQHDTDLLRRLAERKAGIAQDPINLERRELWYKLDAGAGGRPMILAEAGGVRDQILPLPDSILECEDSWARNIEKQLRFE